VHVTDVEQHIPPFTIPHSGVPAQPMGIIADVRKCQPFMVASYSYVACCRNLFTNCVQYIVISKHYEWQTSLKAIKQFDLGIRLALYFKYNAICLLHLVLQVFARWKRRYGRSGNGWQDHRRFTNIRKPDRLSDIIAKHLTTSLQ
jgi:hypothetical protein